MNVRRFAIGFLCGIGVWIAAFVAAMGIGISFFQSATAVSVSLVLILCIVAGFLYRKIGESVIYTGMLASIAIAIILSTACGITLRVAANLH